MDLYSNFKPEALRLNGVKNPIGVSFDPVERMVYWTDVEKREINRASLDGSRQDTIAIENIGRKKDKPSTDYRKPEGRLLLYFHTELTLFMVSIDLDLNNNANLLAFIFSFLFLFVTEKYSMTKIWEKMICLMIFF